ncbi:unnamed protein product [Symbiodinium sp. CCMP2456]|nr:unnamed protein product [Symbiodinium sp. CCMP2456]
MAAGCRIGSEVPLCFGCGQHRSPGHQGGPGGKASLDTPGDPTVARGARGTSEVLSGAAARGRRLLSPPSSRPRESRFLRAGGDSQGEAQVPTAERAMQTACAEISSIFTNSVAPRLTDPGIHSASLQCVRLLELLRVLVLYSRSRPSEASGRRERREADEALIVLPQAKILATVELLLTSLTRETSVASQVLSASSPTGQLVTKALDLLTALLDVCGTAALVFSAQLRRFLELLSDWSPKDHIAHSKVVLSFVLSLERTAPAILLRKPLLNRLCLYAMEAMQHEIGLTGRTASQSARTSRKRKAEVLEDAADFCQPLFPVACQALARLVERGAALLEQQLVASICEQVVHTVWHGALRAPSTVTGKELDRCLVFKQICRSPEAVLGLLEVIEVLVEPRQLGSKPLAPSLLNAFAAILSTLQGAFERHALQKPSDDAMTAGVRTKLAQLADTIRVDQFPRPAEGKGISISWPDASAPESPKLLPSAEPFGATPRSHKETTREAMPSLPTPEKLPTKAPVVEEPMEVDAAETSADAPAATATPEVVRSTKEVQEKEISVDSSVDTFQDTLEEDAGPEVSEEKGEDPVTAAVLPVGAREEEEAAPSSGVQEEVFSTPMNAVQREDFQTPLNSVTAQEVTEANFPDTVPALPEEVPAASSGDGDAKVGDDGKLELFPAEGFPDLGGGMQAASAQIGIGGGILSRGTAQLGKGVATTLQKSEPDMIKALDKALGLDHPTDKVKQAAQKMVNKNAEAAAGGLVAAVSNFSKALSQGELDVAGNVSSALAAVGSALENQKDPLAGQPANSEDMARNAQYAMNNFTSMVRQGEQSLGKIFKPNPQAPNPFQDVFKNPFEKAKPATNPLEAIGNMLPGAQPAASPSPQPGVFQ